MVVSLVTQYRILKFVSINVKETQMLRKPLRDLPGVGTYTDLATAYMETPVMEVIHSLVKRNISCVPIVDRDGMVLNVFEAVDVITLIKGGDYEKLSFSAGKALELRSEVCVSTVVAVFISRPMFNNAIVGLPRHLYLHNKRPHGHHLRHHPPLPCSSPCHHRRPEATQRFALVERYLRVCVEQSAWRWYR